MLRVRAASSLSYSRSASMCLHPLKHYDYRTNYIHRLVPAGGENYTDFNYWRDKPLDIEDFTDSEDDDNDDRTEAASIRSEDEGSEAADDMESSYLSRDSFDEDARLEEYGDDEDTEDAEEGDVLLGNSSNKELIDIDGVAERAGEMRVRDVTPTPRGLLGK
jgi:phosphatidate phosphatase LPIN